MYSRRPEYIVKLFHKDGTTSLLSVRNRTHWKTKRIAKAHADDINAVINKGRNVWNCYQALCVED